MKLFQTVKPAAEPITLEDAKGFLRVLSSEDDVLIGSMISAARSHAEKITNNQFMLATYEIYFDKFENSFTLPRPPFDSLVSFTYVDADGVTQNFSDYDLDDKISPAKIYIKSFPTISDLRNSICITYKAGYATVDDVPADIKAYLRVKVSTLYEHRESYAIGTIISDYNDGYVENLLTPYKVYSL